MLLDAPLFWGRLQRREQVFLNVMSADDPSRRYSDLFGHVTGHDEAKVVDEARLIRINFQQAASATSSSSASTSSTSSAATQPTQPAHATAKEETGAEAALAAVSVHLLPCQIGYSGSAKVSTYFHPAMRSVAGSKRPVSHFRGRKLVGDVLKLPQDSKGARLCSSCCSTPRR